MGAGLANESMARNFVSTGQDYLLSDDIEREGVWIGWDMDNNGQINGLDAEVLVDAGMDVAKHRFNPENKHTLESFSEEEIEGFFEGHDELSKAGLFKIMIDTNVSQTAKQIARTILDNFDEINTGFAVKIDKTEVNSLLTAGNVADTIEAAGHEDGAITANELTTVLDSDQMMDDAVRQSLGLLEEQFAVADADGDGELSGTEINNFVRLEEYSVEEVTDKTTRYEPEGISLDASVLSLLNTVIMQNQSIENFLKKVNDVASGNGEKDFIKRADLMKFAGRNDLLDHFSVEELSLLNEIAADFTKFSGPRYIINADRIEELISDNLVG